jgi:hypothetical protein
MNRVNRVFFFYLTRVVGLLIVFPLVSTFAGCRSSGEFVEILMGMRLLEQVGAITAVFIIIGVLVELTGEILKSLIGGWPPRAPRF